MSERRTYEITQDELDALIASCRPVPYIIVGGFEPPSQQENANAAWRSLATKYGFVWDTVQPITGRDQRFFTAVAS